MRAAHPALPFLAAAAGIALFSLMDGLMKNASIAVGAYSAMLVRSVFGVVLMLPLWRLTGGRWPAAAALRLHALRGAISAVMATTFFWGLVRLPLAEAIALSFIAPLIALYLAAVMLGEQIERRAILASLLGFAGVLVIAAARLNGAGFSPDAAWGIAAVLFSAVLYAINLILQRKQAQLASPQEVALFQMGWSGLFLTLAAPWLLVLPGAGHHVRDRGQRRAGGGFADAAQLGLWPGGGASLVADRVYRVHLGRAARLVDVRRAGDCGHVGRGRADRARLLDRGAWRTCGNAASAYRTDVALTAEFEGRSPPQPLDAPPVRAHRRRRKPWLLHLRRGQAARPQATGELAA